MYNGYDEIAGRLPEPGALLQQPGGPTCEERAFLYQRVNERVWSDDQRKAFLSALRNLVRWLPTQQRSLIDRLAKLTIPTLVSVGRSG